MNFLPENKLRMMFLLVGSGAFAQAVANILRKKYLDLKANVDLVVVSTMFGISAFALPAQFLLEELPKIPGEFWTPFILTVLFNVGIMYWLIKAMSLEDVSVVSALQGITPMFVILTSWIILKEFPTIYGLVGILVIVLGTYILNLKGPDSGSSGLHRLIQPWRRIFSSPGARLALLTAFLGSIALNFDKLAVIYSTPMLLTGIKFLAVGIIIYLISKLSGRWQKMDRRLFWPLFGVGLILGSSEVLMNTGFLYGIVPYVGSLKRMQIVWTAMLAGIFLGEKYSRVRITAAVIIVIGITLIAL